MKKLVLNTGEKVEFSRQRSAANGGMGKYVFGKNGQSYKLDEDGKPMKRPLSTKFKLKAAAAVAGLASLLPINYMAHSAAVPEADASYNPDAVVVLTGGQARIATGLMECDANDRLFISGVNRNSSLQDIFNDCGIDPRDAAFDYHRAELGYNAMDTVGNAQEVGQWLRNNPEIKKVTLVTSAYHKARAMLECEREFPEGVEVKCKTVQDYLSTPGKREATFDEILKFNYSFLIGDSGQHLYNSTNEVSHLEPK